MLRVGSVRTSDISRAGRRPSRAGCQAVLVLKDIHIYGRGISAVPRDEEPLMSTLENPLERNHKGPVGKVVQSLT